MPRINTMQTNQAYLLPALSPVCKTHFTMHYGPRLANVGCKVLRHRGVICQTVRQLPQLDAALGGDAHAKEFFLAHVPIGFASFSRRFRPFIGMPLRSIHSVRTNSSGSSTSTT